MTGKQSIEADFISAARWFRVWVASLAFHLVLGLHVMDGAFLRLTIWCAAWTIVSLVLAAHRVRRGWYLQQILEHAADCPHCRARLCEHVER